ncbi:Phage tail protein [Gammaproteobacteria bacterium]
MSQYQTLFALLGTTYGGDGVNTFGLPDLRGRFNIGAGNGPGLTSHVLGAKGGSETVTLTEANLPSHSHPLNTAGAAATTPTTGTGVTFCNTNKDATSGLQDVRYVKDGLASTVATKVNPADATIKATGGNQPHDNIMPSLAINYIIAWSGLFPT